VTPSQSFACAEGVIMLAAANDGQFRRLCEAVGMPGLAQEPCFVDNAARVRNRSTLTQMLQSVFQRGTVKEWVERLVAAGVPCGPVNDIAAVFGDPQVQARGLRMEVEHPAAGTLELVASPLRLSASPVSYRLPPPLLGEHTDEVLSELLGMTPAELASLREAAII
jgi:crotonobetainyl-CoA:carnitine CoA-transferase CaiB-like acyl-CoA transferase